MKKTSLQQDNSLETMKSSSKKKTRFNLKTHSVFLLLLCLGTLVTSCKKDNDSNPLESTQYYSLQDGMRKLWNDHMQYTYATVDAYFNNPSGLSSSLNRLLENQKDIGAAIVPYYGQAAGDTLSALLTTHINLAVPVLEAAKNNDQPALNQALANWKTNANDIANFLSTANPKNWPPRDMQHMMEMHIDQTTTYAVDLLNKDYNNAITHYDEANQHMLDMADDLAKGIALQFPDKF
ncbi:MAG TPA: hypothetical protein PLM03_08430 [Bacteroidia bacterium]|nr:hypothetical protein [Bacteroidia bacterium]HND72025.1 hypothetical protein [Bacteroidia bacterium]HRH82649.1 hypothetical protein [Bacteroidia bacterium]